MKRQTLKANYLETISWFDNILIDWGSAGKQYFLNGKTRDLFKYHYTMNFDGCITSSDKRYAFVYKRLGTKGLLFKEGDLIREINRPYYCSELYEYPAAFATLNNITYLIHCPIAYNQLDFENVETGELVTNIPDRKAEDVFHSRLEVSPDNKFLLSKGWVWHPVDIVHAFNLPDCIANPILLDNSKLYANDSNEFCTASFIGNDKVLIGSSNEVFNKSHPKCLPAKSIAIWDLKTDQLSKPSIVHGEFGNLFAINEHFTWDLFKFPKIIDIRTGEIVDRCEDIDSGEQNSSIIHHLKAVPQIVFNRQTGQIALTGNETIDVLTPQLL